MLPPVGVESCSYFGGSKPPPYRISGFILNRGHFPFFALHREHLPPVTGLPSELTTMIKSKITELIGRGDLKRFLKFALVGGVVFLIHTAMLWFFKRVLLIPNLPSSIIAYLIGALCNFLLNNFFTFRDSDAAYKRRILGFAAVAASNFVLNTIVVNVVLTYVLDNVLLATVASTATTMCFSFFVLHKVVYRSKQ